MANSIIKTTLVSDTSNYNKGLKDAKRTLDSFGSAVGVHVKTMTGFGAAIGAVSGAVKLMKDIFKASESSIDEWGRITASTKSVYEGFLNSINNGDISGFLNKISAIKNAAREAYDEMDRLGTQKAIDAPRLQAQQTENERFRAMLRTGRYIAPNDGRKANMKDGAVLTDAQKANIAKQLENGLAKVNTIVRSQIDQTTRSIDALYTKQAKELGLSTAEFKKGTSSMQEFDKRMEGYANYVAWEKKNMESQHGQYVYASGNNPYAAYKAWGTFKDDGDTFKSIVDLINERSGLQSQNYAATASAYKNINTATGSGTGSGRGGGGKVDPVAAQGTIDWYNQEISKLNKTLSASADAEVRINCQKLIDDYKAAISEIEAEASQIGQRIRAYYKSSDYAGKNDRMLSDLQGSAFSTIDIKANDKDVTKLNIKPEELKKATDEATRLFLLGKQVGGSWQEAAQAVGGLGSALAGIEDPAAKVFGIIAEAIANVALSMAQALTKKESQMGGVWGWIAAAAAGTATMIGTISAIKSATSYHAEGGIVGTSALARGTDTVPAMLTPGEIVLNRAQQGVLANRLQNSAFGQMQLSATIKGEDIRLALNNGSRRRGKGEYVTSK